MRRFFSSLFSGDEREIDSVIVCGVLALCVFFGVTIYVVFKDHAAWSPTAFSTSVLTIIGATAGGKTGRDFAASKQAEGPK